MQNYLKTRYGPDVQPLFSFPRPSSTRSSIACSISGNRGNGFRAWGFPHSFSGARLRESGAHFSGESGGRALFQKSSFFGLTPSRLTPTRLPRDLLIFSFRSTYLTCDRLYSVQSDQGDTLMGRYPLDPTLPHWVSWPDPQSSVSYVYE